MGLAGVETGEEVLEFGPGFGATTRVLADRPAGSTCWSSSPATAGGWSASWAEVTVTQGDASAMPYEDGSFSAVLCFTMLHHLPTPELQDRAFAEARRVLRPGGVFAGHRSIGDRPVFKLIHVGDTLNPIDPARCRCASSAPVRGRARQHERELVPLHGPAAGLNVAPASELRLPPHC